MVILTLKIGGFILDILSMDNLQDAIEEAERINWATFGMVDATVSVAEPMAENSVK